MTRPGRDADGATHHPSGQFRGRLLFLMDRRRLPDRIPPECPAARAAPGGRRRESVPFARHRHDFFV